jgi:MFS family permease
VESAIVRPWLSSTVIALGFVSLLNDIGGDLVTPLLPSFVAAVGGGPQVLGLIEGMADAATSLVQLGSGYLADRLGRLKLITFAGYGIAAVARPLLALAGAWWQIMVVRLADRIGKGVRSAPRDALVAEATVAEARGRAYGFHRAMDNGGAALGPAAAYLMLRGGMSLRAAFAWPALPGALALLTLGLGVRKVVAKRHSKERSGIGLRVSLIYRRVLLAVFIFALGNSSDAFLLWRAGEIGIPTEFTPLLWMVLALVKSATSTWGGGLSDRVGRRIPILLGWALYALCYLGFGFAESGWQVWLLFASYGAFFGLTEGTESALVVDLVDQQWRGRALGAYNAAVGIATLPASLLFGALYQTAGAKAAFTMGAGLAIMAAIVLPRRLERKGADVGRMPDEPSSV